MLDTLLPLAPSGDALARLIQLVALLLFLAPAVLALTHRQRLWTRRAAAAVLAGGLFWALIALGMWLTGTGQAT